MKLACSGKAPPNKFGGALVKFGGGPKGAHKALKNKGPKTPPPPNGDPTKGSPQAQKGKPRIKQAT